MYGLSSGLVYSIYNWSLATAGNVCERIGEISDLFSLQMEAPCAPLQKSDSSLKQLGSTSVAPLVRTFPYETVLFSVSFSNIQALIPLCD